ncbi:MAG: hypothetical protein JZU63_00190, partial [Rhodoferax sp.]|nr:hypothetical protein [Rhodoferax sp.]
RLNNALGVAGTSTITGAAHFYNTGTIRLGDYLSDVFNFNGGISALATSGVTVAAGQINATNSRINLPQAIGFNESGTVKAGTGQIDLGAMTLAAGVTAT